MTTVPPDRSAIPPEEPAWRPTLPASIGAYRILGILGVGGMGAVYEAEQDNPLRKVALKVIRPELVSPDLVKRFNRESDVLGRLEHPGIARIYEAGTAEGPHGPQPFFAMELVKGDDLDTYARLHKLTVSQRLGLFIRICEAVHYAHQQGVIHRDLKPANILVDATGQPKILDFGVARLNDPELKVTRQTTVGQVVGTLQYMSPEQVNADPLDLDTRSDVYSLGVILYELLAERLPYDISRHMLHEAAMVILQVDPAPLSSVDRNLRGDVETIVSKALEKEKNRRYSSADELASDIRRFLNHEPISARPASAMYQLRKFAARNRALVGGLTLAMIILVIGTVVSLWQAVRATQAEKLAESRRAEAVTSGTMAEQGRAEAAASLLAADSARADAQREKVQAIASAEQARREVAKAKAVNAFLQDMLGSADPSRARGQELTMGELLDQAAITARDSSGRRQPEVQAAVNATIGRTYFSLGRYEQARPLLDSAYAIRTRVLGASSLDLAQSATDRAELATQVGEYQLAEKRLTEALAIERRQLAPNDDRIAADLSSLARIRYSVGDNAAAERLYRQALALAISRHGKTGTVVASHQRALGAFLSFLSRTAEADTLLKSSMAMMRLAFGTNHPQLVTGAIALGDNNLTAANFPAAEQNFQEGLTIAHTIFGQEHPTVADLIARLGSVKADEHRYEEAEPLLREALAMRIRLLGEQHPDVQLVRTELGRLLERQQRFDSADSLFTAALLARRAALSDSSPAVASSLQDLGYSAELAQNWTRAEQYYRESLVVWRKGHYERDETGAMGQLGWALAKQNRLDEAEPILRDVLVRQQKAYGDSSWLAGDAYEKLAFVEMSRGNLAKAESLSVAGLAIRRAVYGLRSPQAAEQLQNLAYMRELQSDTTGAVPYLRESFEIISTTRPPGDFAIMLVQQWLAVDLCSSGRVKEGRTLAEQAVALVPLDSTNSLSWRLRSSLGYCLSRAAEFAEAEPLLLQGEAGLRAVPNVYPGHLNDMIQRLVSLYHDWGKPEQEAAWRDKLAH